MTCRFTRLLTPMLAALALTTGLVAHAAADFPDKPIRLVMPYPPGGPTDLLARVVAMEMSQSLGQSVVVDNRPGASGMIGTEAVARARPDGYTIVANPSLHVINPSIYADMRYDPVADFVPVTQLAQVPLVLIVPATSATRTVSDLVALGKSRKNGLSYGSGGIASSHHLAAESFRTVTKIPMLHVPYKGSSPALTDLVSGQVDFMFDSLSSAMPFIQSGQLRAIAVTTRQRAPALPEVPTVGESGYPGFDIGTWYGVWAPKGTPADVVQKLSQHVARALQQPQVQKRYAALGAQPVGSTPKDFADYQGTEARKWAEIVRRAGIEKIKP
ncbi:tripartite tricarboxylate transporter substrate binding protein [Imbroritus primus]|uniref:Tripartite tricarboxylate transporter substrate binding protein n=1 Tax=Imbroritus primus TaxID=3058603 RepID=A0ACD3SPW5_9BURK|nr:tripartite tricarboxylate transporter substrate binding protein [Burkholderiaceae bacterium PBA]